jgi:hypothetical protein
LNKALLDTDILSEIGKAKDATVATNAKTYRRSFGHYTQAASQANWNVPAAPSARRIR